MSLKMADYIIRRKGDDIEIQNNSETAVFDDLESATSYIERAAPHCIVSPIFPNDLFSYQITNK